MLMVRALMLLLATGVAQAQAPMVTASVNRAQAAVNETFIITVTAQGSTFSVPVFPSVPGLTSDQLPQERSIQKKVIIDRGQKYEVSTMQWRYNVKATKEGSYTIPPMKLWIDGSEFSTEPLTIKIVPAAAPAPAQPGAKSPHGPTIEDALFIESTTDKQSLYQGEAMMLTLRIYKIDLNSVSIQYTMGQNIPLPSREGFYNGLIRNVETHEKKNGFDYAVQEWKMVLFATNAGHFQIGPWQWGGIVMAQTDQGLQRVSRNLQTPPIDIEVKPLPPQPAGFSGAVGRFTIKGSMAAGDVVQGVPAQLLLRVTGEGNSDAIGQPTLPPIPWAQVSEAEVADQPDRNNPIKVDKTFTFKLTPTEAGEQRMPEIPFIYFDPKLSQYKTEKVNSFPVTVKASLESSKLVVAGGADAKKAKQVEILGEDLLPIFTDLHNLSPTHPHPGALGGAVVAPPLAYGLLFGFIRRRKRLSEDQGYARNLYAKSKSRKRLRNVAQSKEPAQELYRALRGYLADKFNLNEAGLTSQDARQIMESHGVENEVVEAVVKILRACEREQYAAVKLSPIEVNALTNAAIPAMDQLDAILQRRA